MDRFLVAGGARLAGEVSVTGAKNSVLKLMACSLLAEGRTTLTAGAGHPGRHDHGGGAPPAGLHGRAPDGTVTIDVPATPFHEADYDLVRRIRASIAVLGPLVARCGQAKVALPGGDAIGSRGLGMHVAGLVKLGATVDSEHGYLIARAPRLRGAQVWLDFPSVGATENLLMAAGPGAGHHRHRQRRPRAGDRRPVHDAHRDGARIGGIGSSTLTIDGVESLRPGRARDRAGPDRRRDLGGRGHHDRGGRLRARRRVEHLEMPLDKLVAGRRRGDAGRGRLPGRDGPPARGGGRRDAALPGLRDRLPAAVPRAEHRGRGHRHDHRERLRVAVDVRRRAGAPRARTCAPTATTPSYGGGPAVRALR
jgi:UDP-N-acetylglucosamine 1-carboxyvinyltransferase